MKTTVDIDEALLRKAEALAQQQGKSLAAVLEEALRATIQAPRVSASPSAPPGELADPLDGHDPFFTALEEIRALGRAWMGKPTVNLR